MGALVVVVFWIGLNLSIEYFQKKRRIAKRQRVRRSPERTYDFDILTDDYDDYTELKKSA